jgi:hypothetical protein
MQTSTKNTLIWGGCVILALLFAAATPKGRSVLGTFPTVSGTNLNQQLVIFPEQLPAERTLALIGYQRGQGEHLNGWINGMGLRQDSSIPWVLMVLVKDASQTNQKAVQERLMARAQPQERANTLPVATDREFFAQSVGVQNLQQVSALVVNRNGEVLARAEGPYDADKARILMDTLRAKAY